VRNAFADEIASLATEDRRIVLLSGDIGNRLFDGFRSRFPDRFFNCGVAEANMVSLAAGLAMRGLRPVVYTIASFATSRCLEQIRVDCCYHALPVVIVGAGAGLSYASLGATHHACEDVAWLRVIPGMTVLCPGDPLEVRGALRAAVREPGPVYLRLGKKGEPTVHAEPPRFVIGEVLRVRSGHDVSLLAVGTVLPSAVAVADRLGNTGLSVDLASFHTVKPLDTSHLSRVFETCAIVATIEEHGVAGGAGGAVAEWRARHPEGRGRLLCIGTPDAFLHEAGSTAHARRKLGLTPEAIADSILAALAVDRSTR